MENQTLYTFKANLQDLIKLQKGITKAQVELSKLKKTDKEYQAQQKKLKGMQKQFNGNAAAMNKATGAANGLNKAGGKMINTFKSAAIAIAAAFAVRAIVGGIKSIISTFTEFEAQMAAVAAISGATGDEFKKLEATALKLGASTVFTATQVAQLQEEFARLGFTVDEIDAATESTLDLAAATGESLAKSAQIAGSTLRGFGIDAELTVNVTDIMAASFTSSALNLDRFTESMKFVAPVARAVGFTLEETTAVLAQLSNSGISGSIAGNSLKNILLRLGDANSDLSKKLGGTIQGIPQLAVAMRKLADEGFGATEAVELLDKRSAPAFLALINNIDGLEDSIDILNNAEGAVTRMAAIRLDTLQGDFTILKSATEGLSIALGEQFDINLRNIVYSLTNFIQGITESESALKTIQTVTQLVGAALLGLTARLAGLGIAAAVRGVWGMGVAMVAMTKSTWALVGAKAGLTTATYSARTATLSLKAAFASTPWGFVIQVVTTLAAAFFLMGEEASEAEMKQLRLNDALSKDVGELANLHADSLERAQQMRRFANEYGDIIGLIDIELASQKELQELKTLMLKHEEDKLKLQTKTTAIDDLEREIILNQDLVNAAKAQVGWLEELYEKAKTSGDYAEQWEASKRMLEAKNTIQQQARLKAQKERLEKEVQDIKDRFSKELVATEIYQNLKLNGEDTFQKKKRDFYNEELEVFRNHKGNQKAIAMKAKYEELEAELSIVAKYRDAKSAEEPLIGEALEQAQMMTANFAATALAMGVDVNATSYDISKLNIELTVLRKFLIQVDSATVRVGGSLGKLTEVAFSFSLNRTKDQFKKLSKLMDALIDNQFDLASKQSENKYNASVRENEEQMVLMNTNISNISVLQEDSSKKELASLIKANKSKFNAIKNLSVEAYKDAIDGEKGNKTAMLEILQAMLDEEGGKLTTAFAYQAQLYVDHNATLERIQNERDLSNAEDIAAQSEEEVRGFERDELNFFKAMQKRKNTRETFATAQIKIIEDVAATEQKNSDKALAEGLITEAEHQRARVELERQAATDIAQIRQDGMDANVADQLETINKIAQYYNMAFSGFSTFFNNKMALEKQRLSEFYEVKSDDLNTSLERELEALDGNSEAQEDVRERYALLQEENEEKKAQKIRAINKKEFQVQKANDIAQAIINGALAMTKVSAQTGVLTLAFSPIIAALVAAQVAAIASQKFVGQQGGVIPEFARGGMVVGPSHAGGGVKFAVGGRVAELEGGEAVINRRSTGMFREQLSQMNEAGGGVTFANGGIMPGTSNTLQASSGNNRQIQFDNLASNIISGINSKQVTVTESAITSSQASVSITELTANIF